MYEYKEEQSEIMHLLEGFEWVVDVKVELLEVIKRRSSSNITVYTDEFNKVRANYRLQMSKVIELKITFDLKDANPKIFFERFAEIASNVH